MCSCEPGWTCPQCKGTPFDPMYEWDEVEPVSVQEFESLSRERFTAWEGWK